MPYSKAFLEKLRKKLVEQLELGNNVNTPEFNNTVSDIYTKLINSKPLTLAEEDFICNLLDFSMDGPGSDAKKSFDVENCKGCQNFLFNFKYLFYRHDLN